MLKTKLIGALVLSLSMTSGAFANKLDPKWASARKEANAMGDAAKAGEKGAFQTLVSKATGGDAAAMHNIAWLYKSGFPGVSASPEKACDWYGKASTLKYPPSMHEQALCLFKKSKGPGSGDAFEKQAIRLMSSAGYKGWTKSDVHLSNYFILLRINRIRRGEAKKGRTFDIDLLRAAEIVRSGLQSNPNKAEKARLHSNMGMSATYGIGVSFMQGHEALAYASRLGFKPAEAAMNKLGETWLGRLKLWVPGIKGASNQKREKAKKNCFDKAAARSIDAISAIACGFLENNERRELANLNKQLAYLRAQPTVNKTELSKVVGAFEKRSLKFRTGWKNFHSIVDKMKKEKKLR